MRTAWLFAQVGCRGCSRKKKKEEEEEEKKKKKRKEEKEKKRNKIYIYIRKCWKISKKF